MRKDDKIREMEKLLEELKAQNEKQRLPSQKTLLDRGFNLWRMPRAFI